MEPFFACRNDVNSLYDQIESQTARVQRQYEYARSSYESAQREYSYSSESSAGASGGESDPYAERRREDARRTMQESSRQMRELEAKLQKLREQERELSLAWDEYGESAQKEVTLAETEYGNLTRLQREGGQKLEAYAALITEGDRALTNTEYDEQVTAGSGGKSNSMMDGTVGTSGAGAGAGTSASGTAVGKKKSGQMSSISSNQAGQKFMQLEIGGATVVVPLSQSGAAQAYRIATQTGDVETQSRCREIFEIETLRADLELGCGDPGIDQIGGYYADVVKMEQSGYEAHHIPAKSVQNAGKDVLPAVAMLRDDHKKTSSHAGKSRRRYKSIFPGQTEYPTYKQECADMLAQGRYSELVKDEILDIRSQLGHKYDDGINQMLDAMVDNIARNGIPGAIE